MNCLLIPSSSEIFFILSYRIWKLVFFQFESWYRVINIVLAQEYKTLHQQK